MAPTTVEGAAEDNADEALARAGRCIDAVLAQAGPLAGQISAAVAYRFARSE